MLCTQCKNDHDSAENKRISMILFYFIFLPYALEIKYETRRKIYIGRFNELCCIPIMYA